MDLGQFRYGAFVAIHFRAKYSDGNEVYYVAVSMNEHHHPHKGRRYLGIALGITTVFFIVELVGE